VVELLLAKDGVDPKSNGSSSRTPYRGRQGMGTSGSRVAARQGCVDPDLRVITLDALSCGGRERHEAVVENTAIVGGRKRARGSGRVAIIA